MSQAKANGAHAQGEPVHVEHGAHAQGEPVHVERSGGPVRVQRLGGLELEERIRSRLQCRSLELIDDSHKHAGHAGAAGGAAHFTLHLVSDDFVGLSRVARHRLVYDAVSDLMPHRLHALVIDARTVAEAGAPQNSAPSTTHPS